MGGVSSTSIISGIGVFRCVIHWWMQGVICRTRGHFGLLDTVNPAVTLGDGVVSTLDGVAPSTLCGPVLFILIGVAIVSLS